MKCIFSALINFLAKMAAPEPKHLMDLVSTRLFNSKNQQVQGFVNENSNVPKNHKSKFLKMLTASENSELKLLN